MEIIISRLLCPKTTPKRLQTKGLKQFGRLRITTWLNTEAHLAHSQSASIARAIRDVMGVMCKTRRGRVRAVPSISNQNSSSSQTVATASSIQTLARSSQLTNACRCSTTANARPVTTDSFWTRLPASVWIVLQMWQWPQDAPDAATNNAWSVSQGSLFRVMAAAENATCKLRTTSSMLSSQIGVLNANLPISILVPIVSRDG